MRTDRYDDAKQHCHAILRTHLKSLTFCQHSVLNVFSTNLRTAIQFAEKFYNNLYGHTESNYGAVHLTLTWTP